MSLFDRIAERFSKVKPLPEGLHQMQAILNDKPYRLHLRLQKNGAGVLIVNASTVLQLNPSAAEYAYHFVKGTAPEEAAKQIAARYRVSKVVALNDYEEFVARVQTLIDAPDLDPVTYLDFERIAPRSAELSAPLRLDCALTYRLPSNTSANDAPAKRVERELTSAEWNSILDKAWQAGIPHITFTGGEPTLRDDLPELIAHAEKNGQVCGLLSDGLKLADKKYLQLLLQTGLDHLLFILQMDNSDSWRALEIIMPEDLFTTVHITLTKENISGAAAALEKCAALGVKSLSLSIADVSLNESLTAIKNKSAQLGFTLRFDLPVPYSAQHPVAYETSEDNVISGAGKAWLYVEPDGDVLPAQVLADQILGNILRDPWDKLYR